MTVRKVYNFMHMARSMTINEFYDLPENVQDRYLTWSKEQFERERAQILFERAGGVPGIARTKAMTEIAWLETIMVWSWAPAHISSFRKTERRSEGLSIYNDSPIIYQY